MYIDSEFLFFNHNLMCVHVVTEVKMENLWTTVA